MPLPLPTPEELAAVVAKLLAEVLADRDRRLARSQGDIGNLELRLTVAESKIAVLETAAKAPPS